MQSSYRPQKVVLDIKTLSEIKAEADAVSLLVTLNNEHDTNVKPSQGAVATNALFFKNSPAFFPFTNNGQLKFVLRIDPHRGEVASGSFDLSDLAGIMDPVIERSISLQWLDPSTHKFSDPRPRLSFKISLDPPPPSNLNSSVWDSTSALDTAPSASFLHTSHPDSLLFSPQKAPSARGGVQASLWYDMINASLIPAPTSENEQPSAAREAKLVDHAPPPPEEQHLYPPQQHQHRHPHFARPMHRPPGPPVYHPEAPYPPPPMYGPRSYGMYGPPGAYPHPAYYYPPGVYAPPPYQPYPWPYNSGDMTTTSSAAPPQTDRPQKKGVSTLVKKLMRSKTQERMDAAEAGPTSIDPRLTHAQNARGGHRNNH